MMPGFLYFFVFFMLFFVRNCFAFGWQGWVEISSVVQPNSVNITFPQIVRQGGYLRVTYNIPSGISYRGTLRNTYGPQSCSEPYYNMELGGVLKFPNKISANLIDLEFVSVDTPAKQTFRFRDGAVGVYDISGTTPQDCQYYVNQLDKPNVTWYGTGRSIVVTYQVVKLKGTGQDTLVVDTAFTPTRRQANAQPWLDGDSIKNNLGSSVSAQYQIVDFCSLDVNSAEGITLDHGTLTPDLVNGHKVSKTINFSCTSGTSGGATLYLSNQKGDNDVVLSNGYRSSLHLDKTKLSIPRGGKESVKLSSTLNSSKVVAGAFEGHDILTVIFD
ncbi:hypothetical protein LNZ58_003524 [Escherichia coli]|nr:hypothetical protein [Escherichia coli]